MDGISAMSETRTTQQIREQNYILPKKVTTPSGSLYPATSILMSTPVPCTPMAEQQGTTVRLETSMGEIVLRLRSDMPITAGNFEKLVRKGFYNGSIFHRIIDKFMIQGGDPTGTGRGGPGFTIKDEFAAKNRNVRGTIAMANAGPNTGGSQFFINLVDNTYLDRKHPVFGEVIQGMDIVDAIAKVPTDSNDRPKTPVRIVKAEVL
jgi:peptidylprolyl isomerase